MNTELSYISSNTVDPNYPAFKMVINGKVTKYYLIPAGLEISLTSDGIYPLLNRGCGFVGCGGAYVKVKLSINTVIWETVYPEFYDYNEDNPEINVAKSKLKLSNDEYLQLPLTFTSKSYSEMVLKILSEKNKYTYEKDQYLQDVENFRNGRFFYN